MSYKNFKAHALVLLAALTMPWTILWSRYVRPIVMWYVVCIVNDNDSKKKMEILWGSALYFLITFIGTE